MLAREAMGGRTMLDALRGVLAGAATVLLFRSLPALSPFIGIPLCIVAFAIAALLVGAAKRSDVQMLLSSVRR
jgi:hypothetical protein